MTAARYVLTISAGTAESLTAHAQGLAAFLTGDGPRVFGHTATLPGVAATLLHFRPCAPHRLALSAGTLAEAAAKLTVFGEHASNPELLAPQGLYARVVDRSAFDGVEDQDLGYLLALAASARHDQLARLWSVGFPVDWRHVYPELAAERPVYLPPAPLRRRRYWPGPRTESPPEETTTAAPMTTAAPTRVVTAEQAPPAQLLAELTNLPTPLRVRRVCDYLQDHIARLLDYPRGERPHTGSGFFDLGMSSIHLAQLREHVITDTGFAPAETSAFDHPTIAEFATHLARELARDTEPEAASGPELPLLHTLGHDDIDRLSPHELERTLVEVLS
ncbi:acyl carrier protein [Lentzea sp. HUAS12]|uniref:acyl carrier protein n=1 Tax=Lentzea sp. HUAS12 TaxID=2951806 RepID=UPI00209EC2E8|nr:phosphopantetheine-binding protein [Lentzea sp. HUAS12]USX56208.1 phosphopantetheine-binding protein [Lentzea sp. HUAS12]